jgi:hypothetical protein
VLSNFYFDVLMIFSFYYPVPIESMMCQLLCEVKDNVRKELSLWADLPEFFIGADKRTDYPHHFPKENSPWESFVPTEPAQTKSQKGNPKRQKNKSQTKYQKTNPPPKTRCQTLLCRKAYTDGQTRMKCGV